MGLSYPTHCLKSRGSVIKNNVLEYRTREVIIFALRNVLQTLFAINKTKHIFRVPVVTQFILKV